jgi:hypothetical protein
MTVSGSVAILRHIVGLPSILSVCNRGCDDACNCVNLAIQAALITSDSRRDGFPTVRDTLAILRFLVGLESRYLDPIWNNGGAT